KLTNKILLKILKRFEKLTNKKRFNKILPKFVLKDNNVHLVKVVKLLFLNIFAKNEN
ncbi:hypothetical protein CVS40_12523, partial [Lucilia cuprina]